MSDSMRKRQLISGKELQELERLVEKYRRRFKPYRRRFDFPANDCGEKAKYIFYLSNRSDSFSY